MHDEPPALLIREIGSFFVGGERTRLQGLPARARVSTSHGPVHPIDPNGEIIAGQMVRAGTSASRSRARRCRCCCGTAAG